MADQMPGNDVSSYSDPIYDRLEGINKFLAKNWLLLSIVILGVVITLTAINTMDGSSEAARGAIAYTDAGGDTDKLIALCQDESIVPEFRFQAANDLVQIYLDKNTEDGSLDKANEYLSLAASQAKLTENSEKLSMYALISKAALQDQAGEIEAALQTYQEALRKGSSGDYKAARYIAKFNRAQLLVLHAASIEDKEEASTLRQDALLTYEELRSDNGLANNRSRLQDAATYAYWSLLRAYPDLQEEEELPSEDAPVEEAIAPETEKKAE